MSLIRSLGSSGLQTPPLVLGGNVFGWTADRETSFDILDRFVARGGTMIDTADVYSSWVPGNEGGESESIIGEWLKRRDRRDDVLIATKVGYDEGLAAGTIAAAIDRSLQRLGTDYVDLYFSHKDDPNAPLEETLGAFDRLVHTGKVRAIGASQIEAPRLREALDISAREGLASYSVLQTWYNLLERPKYEGELSALVQERGLGMVAFYGLASGFLSGKYRSEADLGKSPRGGGLGKYLDARGISVLAALDEVAAETGATPAQAALAWLSAQPAVTAPIASATSLEQLEELLGAMELELTPDQVERLNAASAQ
ncbi:MAG TPA: aldo/keto reductase [Allosphingosinicella sp.]|uniref:aldo/keto reductase n=1 Tax=Allosphingosinicella sp. TaxID=2823234 RepID=UPI002EDB06D4